MGSTPDARDTGSTALVETEETALSLDPSAAPLLRKAVPEIEEKPMTRAQQITTGVFVFTPMLALLAAIPFAWGWGLNWHDIVIERPSTGSPGSVSPSVTTATSRTARSRRSPASGSRWRSPAASRWRARSSPG
jgi:hypothetical protein